MREIHEGKTIKDEESKNLNRLNLKEQRAKECHSIVDSARGDKFQSGKQNLRVVNGEAEIVQMALTVE